MTSWTNATEPDPGPDRPVLRSPRTGLGSVVHPQRTDAVLERTIHPVTDPALHRFVEHFWTVRWDRRGAPPAESEVITSPCCHLTFEDGHTAGGAPLVRHGVPLPAAVVTTVWTDRFRVALEGDGRAFGVRFRPGALADLINRPLAADRSEDAETVLPGAAALLEDVLREPDDEQRRNLVQHWLSGRVNEPGADYRQTAAIIALIERDSTVVQVEQIGRRVGMSTRNVQRLFKFYLGVPPKWVLMRSRLQDAAAALDADPATDLAAVAFRLGWYDQPHFVRDFRRFLGVTPGQYARDAAGRS